MTEKEFIQRSVSRAVDTITMNDTQIEHLNRVALSALEYAKSQGAEFDPEIVELPKLRVSFTSHGYNITLVEARETNSGYGPIQTVVLTKKQALEVIRRCELIPKLKEYIQNKWRYVLNDKHQHEQVVICADLLNIIDGKDD